MRLLKPATWFSIEFSRPSAKAAAARNKALICFTLLQSLQTIAREAFRQYRNMDFYVHLPTAPILKYSKSLLTDSSSIGLFHLFEKLQPCWK